MGKKGISPVVAVALLLVLVVVSVVGFQNWFNSYQIGVLVDTETQSNSATNGEVKIEKLIDTSLYVINNVEDNLSINELKISGEKCIISKKLRLGMNKINVSDCIEDINSSMSNVVLATNSQISENYFYVEKVQKISIPSCVGDWVQATGPISNICVYNLDLGVFTWKSDVSSCESPQCENNEIVRDNAIDFSSYPGRDKCKELGGYLANMTQLSEINLQKVLFNNLNQVLPFWAADERGQDNAFFYSFGSGAGFGIKNTLFSIVCVKNS